MRRMSHVVAGGGSGGGNNDDDDDDDEAAGRKEERRLRRRLPLSRRVATMPLGNAEAVEAVEATMIAIVAARRKDAAGRHRHCNILGRDATECAVPPVCCVQEIRGRKILRKA